MNFWFSVFTILGCFQASHALYISVTDVEYREAQNLLRVQVKIFTNDLEDDIRNQSGQIIKLQDGISKEESDRVDNYLSKNMELLVDNTLPLLEKSSCQVEGDAVFFIYEGELANKPRKLWIKNRLLLGLFPTQTNIIRLKNEDWKGILKLNKKEITGELNF